MSIEPPSSAGDIVINAVVRANALQEARIVDDTTIFVWRRNAAEQIEAALAKAGYTLLQIRK